MEERRGIIEKEVMGRVEPLISILKGVNFGYLFVDFFL